MKLCRDLKTSYESGATIVEYALLVALIAVVAIFGIRRLGLRVTCKEFENAVNVAGPGDANAIMTQGVAAGCGSLGAPYDTW